jgi:Beta-propeller repeat
LFRLSRAVTCLFLLPFSFLIQNAHAQIQQAWVARYNNGVLDGTNQAVKIALDSSGNIYVLGFSQNTNTNLGYVTIKYAPNGTQVWGSRYENTNYPTATPTGFALDTNNNVVVTGSALTVKYDTNGNLLWTAPYNGAAIAMDSGGNSIVTGFSSGFNTVKISPNGSNVWSASYVSQFGPAPSQAVVVDGGGNAYVAGSDTFMCYSEGPSQICYNELLLLEYDHNGNQLWDTLAQPPSVPLIQVVGMAIDKNFNVYVEVNGYIPYSTYSYASNGNGLWNAWDPTGDVYSFAYALALDYKGDVVVTGQNANFYPNMQYGTYKMNSNGMYTYTNLFPSGPAGTSVATAIAVDLGNSCYITGFSPGINGTNDIVTIKYDPNGNLIWLQRYSNPNGANAAGNAIAVDNSGNVYVTGYDTTAQGGTEIVTIKYSPVTLQRHSDGTVILQAQGAPGESFDIEASTNLLDWLDLGTVQADTNGRVQFDDTNAPTFPARFYYTTPQ